MEFISRKSLPVSAKGRSGATEPSLSISEMGGIRINAFLLNALAGILGLHLGWDEATRKMTFTGVKELPKGLSTEDLFEARPGNKGKGQASIPALTAFLRTKEYDFAKSGNQKMNLTIGATKSGAYQFSFVLPKGALTPTPKAPRKPRTPKAVVAPASVDASVAGLI